MIQADVLSRIVEGVTARCAANVQWSRKKDSVTFVLGGHAEVVMSAHQTMPSDEWFDAMIDQVVSHLSAYGGGDET